MVVFYQRGRLIAQNGSNSINWYGGSRDAIGPYGNCALLLSDVCSLESLGGVEENILGLMEREISKTRDNSPLNIPRRDTSRRSGIGAAGQFVFASPYRDFGYLSVATGVLPVSCNADAEELIS